MRSAEGQRYDDKPPPYLRVRYHVVILCSLADQMSGLRELSMPYHEQPASLAESEMPLSQNTVHGACPKEREQYTAKQKDECPSKLRQAAQMRDQGGSGHANRDRK